MKIYILIPVYNDWTSLEILLGDIIKTESGSGVNFHFLIVNDASTEPRVDSLIEDFPNLKMIHLKSNLGHQKAIATGICWLNEHVDGDAIIVMDADGEDRPSDIGALVQKSKENKGQIIFAHRKKRQEGILFRFFYFLYKIAFRILTGQSISYGNFSLIPFNYSGQICNLPAMWLHFSGAILHSKLPITTIELDRGRRLNGASKMNFTNLVMHGISAIAVHLERVSVRLLMFSFSIIFVALSGIAVVTFLKLATDMAIPGWASNIFLSFVLIFLQAFFISLMLTFVVLYQRTQKVFLPSEHYKDLISNVETNVHDRK